MEKMTIGKFIAALRRAHGMTQKELGERLFVSDKTVSRWERDECTPELNLIPAIAEIFGVTSDELLRGQRRADSDTAPDTAARLKTKSDKQWRILLQRRTVHFRNLSLISRGIALLGLIAAAICDLCFTRALLGFCLGLVFLLAAGICQLCFAASARLHPEEDEPERHGEIRAFNDAVTGTSVAVFSLIGALLAFLLPLLLVEAYYGLATGSWLLLGLGATAIALVLGHIAYVLAIRGALIRRGLLGEVNGQRAEQEKKLLKKFSKLAAIITAACLVLAFAAQAVGTAPYAAPEEFTSWAEFEDFMYDLAIAQRQEEWEGFTVVPLPDGYQVLDGHDAVTGEVAFQTVNVTDKEGRVLATYPIDRGVSQISFSFSRSDDGLPVKVWTQELLRGGYQRQQAVCTALYLIAAAAWVVCAALYLRRRRAESN